MDIKITTSQLAKAILQLRGKPLSLELYTPFNLVYDTDPLMLVICAGRQVGKSVSLAGSIISKSIIRPHFRSLYIAPLSIQTSRFSTAYLDPFMHSPLVRKYYLDSESKRNVFMKSFNNGSVVYLSYAETEADADRVRGASADSLLIDEVQDVSSDALPVLYETLSASDFSYKRLTGTAKNENGTLAMNWKRSNMLEWVVKCPACSKYAVPHDFETCLKIVTMNPAGPACPYCGYLIDMQDGEWVAMRPDIKDKIGCHIPQFIIPARARPDKWLELYNKVAAYPQPKLANEVFGIAAGTGGKILGMQECMACCNPEWKEFDKRWPGDMRGIGTVVLGVDWSVTGSLKSFTVVSVLGCTGEGKLYLLHTEKLQGIDILAQVKRVADLYIQFSAQLIASDRGVGVLQCQLLQKEFGEEKVAPINYVNAKTHLRWDAMGQYFAADRTMCMDTIVMKMKIGITKFESPWWTLTAPFWEDCLAIFEEETLAGKRVYRHEEDEPDDSFHSVVFANIGMMILRGEFTYVDKPDYDRP